MKNFCNITKIPSALIIDNDLCKAARNCNDTLIISTGMSTENEISAAVDCCFPDIIMHTNSTYPSPVGEINIKYVQWLKEKYPDKVIGYSGHESGYMPTISAICHGAKYIERHITMDKEMWGSDHQASLNPKELETLMNYIREIEESYGQGGPRKILNGEEEKKKSLRG